MIADGDSVSRNAFRAALARDAIDTPLPIPAAANANATQELDPSDILEVRDMAAAIARAEKIVGAPRSSARGLTDLFDSLGHSAPTPPTPSSSASVARATDDTVGPAIGVPHGIPTPIPPRYLTMPSALPLAIPAVAAAVPASPASSSAQLAAIRVDDDAYYHPAGRIRSLADVTLDGYRPEPTLLLRARTRRRHFSWFIAAALVPILALAAAAFFTRADEASASTIATPVQVQTAAPSKPAAPPPVLTAAPVPAPARDTTPVFDVKSLPSAGDAKHPTTNRR